MDEIENENEFTRNKDRSPSPGVKSTAVVKYTAFQTPASYAKLQCNTDINLPPTNWGGIDTYGLKQILTRDSGLSSFRMAHMFPDCVGDVDVISDADCIKNLLKLPYQPKAPVSMMVHRVENTLLLDDFDVYEYLMKSEWSWLKDFFYENVLKTMSEKERMSLTSSASARALQLTHKFLSHSVVAPPLPTSQPSQPICLPGPFLPEPETRPEEPAKEQNFNRNVLWTFEDIHMLIGSNLPIFGDKDRPCVSLRLRDAREPINVLTGIDYWLDNLMCNVPEVLMCYHLDGIVQKYEPMKTEDLPHMENSKFSPKVIRNVAQNILSFLKSNATKAGHTYWLFKGPHDDVVKLYDLTTLCPDDMDNPFTTPVAMLLYRVARNMRLMNRSKHVKQLLEHVVELLKAERYPQIVASSHYMLADLYVPATTNPASPNFKDESSDSEEEGDYANYAEFPPSDSDGRTDKHVEVVQDVTNDVKCDGDGNISQAECERDGDSAGELALRVRGLALRDIGDRHTRDNKKKTKPTTMGLGIEPAARCGRALKHALTGLKALHHLTVDKSMEEERERLRQQKINEEQHPKMANPYEPIKMGFKNSKIKEKEQASRSRRRKRRTSSNYLQNNTKVDKNAILVRKENTITLHEPSRDDNFAWKLHLKTLLYEKICLAYATLAEYSYSHEQYGFSLKYIDMASKCQKLLSNMIIKSHVVDASCLIGRVGDNFFQLSKHWPNLEQYRKQFEMDHKIDAEIRNEIEMDSAEEDGVGGDEFELDIRLPQNQRSAMLLACEYYRKAAQVSDSDLKRDEVLRRRASVCNELAVRCMSDAQHMFLSSMDSSEDLPEEFQQLSERAAEYLDEATEIFQHVNDVPNLALLYCNKARYMRFKVHCDKGAYKGRPPRRWTDDLLEVAGSRWMEAAFDSDHKRKTYNSAEDLYCQALKLVGPRTGAVKELVYWELSCHLYTRAVLMQDHPDVYTSEMTEVAEAFKHALKHCLLSPGPRQYLYQFRAAMIYHRLGSLYHSQYRKSQDACFRRRMLSATCFHYEKAALQFAALEDAAMFLTARLEHIAALEAHAAVSPNLKLKSLQTAIDLLRQCHSIMKVLKDRDPEEQKEKRMDDDEDMSIDNDHSLLSLYENRLHYILKSIIQYCRSKSNKDYDKITDMYKKLYSASLKIKRSGDLRLYAASVCDVLTAMDDITNEFI